MSKVIKLDNRATSLKSHFIAISSEILKTQKVLLLFSPWQTREASIEYIENNHVIVQTKLPLSHIMFTLGQGYCASH